MRRLFEPVRESLLSSLQQPNQSAIVGAEPTGAVRIATPRGEDTSRPANNKAARMGTRMCGSGANDNEMLGIGGLDRKSASRSWAARREESFKVNRSIVGNPQILRQAVFKPAA
jgi:hypothetical protein